MKACCKETIARVPDDEPVFCVLGRDELAVPTLLTWLREAEKRGVSAAKRQRALGHLQDIRDFQKQHPERTHLPD